MHHNTCDPLLLALVPPSCMVAPKRVVANKFFTFPSAFPSNTSMSTLPSIKKMDIDNDSITRGRTTSPSKSPSRSSSISSSTSLMAYHNQMEIENNNPNDGQEDRDESPCLSYADIQANGASTGGRVINEAQTSSIPQPQGNNSLDSEQNADQQTLFRVNLPYDVNQAINPQSTFSDSST